MNIKFENSPAKLKIIKTESNYFAELSIDDYIINKRPLSDYSNYSFLRTKEGESIDVVIDDGKILFEDNVVCTPQSVFDSGKIVVLGRVGDVAYLYLKTASSRVMLQEDIPLEDLPENLFARRKYFFVSVNSDTDMTIIRYANLHQHTEYSLLDGIVKIPDLAKKTEWASAITDHGNMHGFNEFYKAMVKQNKKPIVGCEVYLETPGGKPRPIYSEQFESDDDNIMFDNEKKPTTTLAGEHLILLAENNQGLKNLFHIVTEASLHFYRKPHVTFELLEKYHEGIIATSACIASCLGRSIKEILKCERNMNDPEAVRVKKENEDIADLFLTNLINIFGKDNFFIELQNHRFPLEDEIMQRVRDYAKKYGLKTTIGIDAHYLNKEDEYIHELWLCQQTKKKMDDPDRMRFSGTGYHVHTSDEVLALFPDDTEAMDNTLDIAERCNVNLDFTGYHMPSFPIPEGHENADEYLKYLCMEGFNRLWQEGELGEETQKQLYLDRLKYETDTIIKLGWSTYFLIVEDFISYSRDTDVRSHVEKYFPSNHYDHESIPDFIYKTDEVYVGVGRGSCAGSLVCCCLGITKVDPIKYDLLFERFLSPDRISMPDIDTDFEDAGREKIIEYCRVKYGRDHVARIITFGTAAAKNSVLSVARVLGMPVEGARRIANVISKGPKVTIANELKENNDFISLYKEDECKKIIDLAMKIEGLKTNRSIHACGVIICGEKVLEYMPEVLLENKDTQESFWTTQIQGEDVSDMGCLKMDFLGLKTLGIAHEAINSIKSVTGKDVVYDEIPLNDKDVYRGLAEGRTSGVFQAESEVFRKALSGALKDYEKQVTNNPSGAGDVFFSRLTDCNALVRPGSIQYIDTYKDCVLDPRRVVIPDPHAEEQLRPTNGIILFQEQAMILTRQMAGFSGGQADLVRKGMAKKKKAILDEYEEYFVNGSHEKNILGCVNNGISESVARKIWSDIKDAGSYSFNKSHAVAYSMHSARTAWLMYYYPAEYMCATLNAWISTPEKIQQYISVCRDIGISVLPPDINGSDSGFTCVSDHEIRFGIGGIRNVSKSADELISERKERGVFLSYGDFLYRMGKYHSLNKKVLESLIYAGVLDIFPGSRLSKFMAIEEAVKFVHDAKKETSSDNLFTLSGITDDSVIFRFNDTLLEMPKEELLDKEKEYTGFYITGHPLDTYRVLYDRKPEIVKVTEIEDRVTEGSKAIMLGVIKDLEYKTTKKNKTIITFTLEDITGKIPCVIFRHLKNSEYLQDGKVFQIEGWIQTNDFGTQMKCRELLPLRIR